MAGKEKSKKGKHTIKPAGDKDGELSEKDLGKVNAGIVNKLRGT
jgi:hypothetical protein